MSQDPAIDDAAALAEVEAACDRYEHALMVNDLDTLDALFHPSGQTVRYGPAENLYGIDEIRRYRAARPGGSPARTVLKRVITTYGSTCAISNLEFRYDKTGRLGRQSQSWIRFSGSWHIVSAHVSLLPEDLERS